MFVYHHVFPSPFFFFFSWASRVGGEDGGWCAFEVVVVFALEWGRGEGQWWWCTPTGPAHGVLAVYPIVWPHHRARLSSLPLLFGFPDARRGRSLYSRLLCDAARSSLARWSCRVGNALRHPPQRIVHEEAEVHPPPSAQTDEGVPNASSFFSLFFLRARGGGRRPPHHHHCHEGEERPLVCAFSFGCGGGGGGRDGYFAVAAPQRSTGSEGPPPPPPPKAAALGVRNATFSTRDAFFVHSPHERCRCTAFNACGTLPQSPPPPSSHDKAIVNVPPSTTAPDPTISAPRTARERKGGDAFDIAFSHHHPFFFFFVFVFVFVFVFPT